MTDEQPQQHVAPGGSAVKLWQTSSGKRRVSLTLSESTSQSDLDALLDRAEAAYARLTGRAPAPAAAPDEDIPLQPR